MKSNELKELEKIDNIVAIIDTYCKYYTETEEINRLEPLIEYLSEIINNLYFLGKN